VRASPGGGEQRRRFSVKAVDHRRLPLVGESKNPAFTEELRLAIFICRRVFVSGSVVKISKKQVQGRFIGLRHKGGDEYFASLVKKACWKSENCPQP